MECRKDGEKQRWIQSADIHCMHSGPNTTAATKTEYVHIRYVLRSVSSQLTPSEIAHVNACRRS